MQQFLLGQQFYLPWFKQDWLNVWNNPDISAARLVNALIACSVTTIFFGNPFFQYPSNVQKPLNYIYWSWSALKPVYSCSETWKATTIKFLDEILASAPMEPEQALQRQLGEEHQNYHSELSKNLVSLLKVSCQVSDEEQSKLLSKITDLVLASSQLAKDWHSRDFGLRLIDISWLKEKNIQWNTEDGFKYTTQYPNSKILDDTKSYFIVAVIFPGFIRYEKEDGEAQYKEIIWGKASVLLAERTN
ncbi:hypothetical protein TWF694_000197 [Orbilia ellipsospora]|uniref:Uncharacterized protein n=1 Tax=Orbilia ellipsospora TaxID=2528407 RepID=A0AAV9XNS9_9PEZI